PPWPFNPHPELEAVEIAPGIFVFDDTGIPDTPEQAAARKRSQEAGAIAKAIAADPLLAAAVQQTEKQIPVESGGPMGVGVGQGRAPRRLGDAQVAELAQRASQPAADFPQAMRPAQLAEEHGHKLRPALKAPGVALGAVLLDQLLKLQARKKLEQLGKHATKSLHRESFRWLFAYTGHERAGKDLPIQFSGNRRTSNLDKSDKS
ncbi:MAG: hypothetical protein QHJ82_16390, partial [Verrucomicrobiota bacterium]|nr:hypothetical protein [Verrucomicrobiota bacterium]